MDLANRILERRGFGNQRINQYWLSAAESERLVKSVEDTLQKITEIGPNPIKIENIDEPNNELLTTPSG